jgi:hypothetical protein
MKIAGFCEALEAIKNLEAFKVLAMSSQVEFYGYVREIL